MKNINAPKYKFGQEFRREGKCSLRICGFSHGGEYLLCQVLRAVSDSELARYFHPDQRKEGAILVLPGNRKRLLFADRGTGYWDWTDPDDLVTLKEAELEALEAEAAMRYVPEKIARLRHPERQSRANRYLPKNAN